MRIIGIIQCRMGSKRLPGKSMLPLAGQPLIYRFIERVKKAEMLDEIVLATTEKPEDDCLINIAQELGIKTFRGAENDLVDRIYKCALEHDVDVIVRLCADNPLIESEEIDTIIRYFMWDKKAVMYSNTHNIRDNGYPDGLGAEVYSIESFKELNFITSFMSDKYREHPHKYFEISNKIETCPARKEIRYSHLKLDVNTQKEYEYVKGIYDKFGHNDFHFRDYVKEV